MNDFNYGIVVEKHVLRSISIVHYCLYEKEPTEKDIESLEEELRTDKKFGLTNFPRDNLLIFLRFRKMSREEIEKLKLESNDNEKNQIS